jgi:hypothetical protein
MVIINNIRNLGGHELTVLDPDENIVLFELSTRDISGSGG